MKNKEFKKLFYAYTKPNGECWEWRGGKNGTGYPVAFVFGKQFAAHRMSWELEYGKIPAGSMVCHRCDNKVCVRPSHLFIGDTHANNDDYLRKMRCQEGAMLPPKMHLKNGRYYYVGFVGGRRRWVNLSRDYQRAIELYRKYSEGG